MSFKQSRSPFIGNPLAKPPVPISLIKTINGLALIFVKTINNLAMTSIKTINGLSNQ